MKKIISALLVAILLAVSLCSCGSDPLAEKAKDLFVEEIAEHEGWNRYTNASRRLFPIISENAEVHYVGMADNGDRIYHVYVPVVLYDYTDHANRGKTTTYAGMEEIRGFVFFDKNGELRDVVFHNPHHFSVEYEALLISEDDMQPAP